MCSSSACGSTIFLDAYDAMIWREEPFCFDLDTYQKYLVRISPLLLLEIEHTFVRILAVYGILCLDECVVHILLIGISGLVCDSNYLQCLHVVI